MGKRVLLVDDEPVVCRSIERILCPPEFELEAFPSGNLALLSLQEKTYDAAITDLKMPGMNGLEVLKAIHILQPEVPVILITGYGSVDTAVEAMKSGAFDYVTKPFTPEQLLEKVGEALAMRPVGHRGDGEQELDQFDEIIGRSPAMQEVYRRIRHVAPTDSTVLITGESGTGKELVAHAIHRHSLRRRKPFVAVDCTALAENLLESELFGHEKGSFTGAVGTKIGLFAVADKGTLFLDEVSNLSLTVQAKLLRALQEREIMPIGGNKSTPVDIRLIVATNRNLRELVAQNTFREDLFFRLNVIPIKIPPLRDREGDLFLLASSFLAKYASKTAKAIDRFSREAVSALQAYDFPGNVRELENIVERAVVLCSGTELGEGDLGLHLPPVSAGNFVPRTAEELKFLKKTVRERAVLPTEKSFVIAALERNGGNVTRAAEETGMLRQNFQALMRKHDIWPEGKRLAPEGEETAGIPVGDGGPVRPGK